MLPMPHTCAPSRTPTRRSRVSSGQATASSSRFFVAGEEVTPDYPVWAELDSGEYVYSNLLRSNPAGDAPPIGSLAPGDGRWIDVNLTLKIVTAYEGQTPVTTFLGSTGQPGWETPPGLYTDYPPGGKRSEWSALITTCQT